MVIIACAVIRQQLQTWETPNTIRSLKNANYWTDWRSFIQHPSAACANSNVSGKQAKV